MRLSPLQLIEYAFDDVNIKAVDGYKPDEEYSTNLVFFPGKLNMSADTGITLLSEEKNYSDFGISLTFRVSPREGKGAPYVAEVTARGVVRMHLTQEKDQAEERRVRALVNGVSLLFGVIREMIASVTSRSKYGQFLLPALNFADLANAAPMEPAPKALKGVSKPPSTKRKAVRASRNPPT